MPIIPQLTPVDPWPTRKLPQERFDAAVKTSMGQMSHMVAQLNGEFIPAANALGEDVNAVARNEANINAVAVNIPQIAAVVDNLPVILDAPTLAESASQSAAAAEAARDAAAVSKAATDAARAEAEMSKTAAETARDAAEASKTVADAARDAAETARDEAEASKTAAETAQAAAETARDEAQSIVGGPYVLESDVHIDPTPDAIPRAGNDGKLDVGWVDPAMSITGNAATATRLQTARTISLTGVVTGSANFDGSEDVSINVSKLTANADMALAFFMGSF